MIITIARQCGCMGDEIGQRLADEYGLTFYNKEHIVATVIMHIGTNIGFKLSHDDIRPTPAGINITGIISIRNRPASLTASSLINPVRRPANKITIP
jgi:hypothetical protein